MGALVTALLFVVFSLMSVALIVLGIMGIVLSSRKKVSGVGKGLSVAAVVVGGILTFILMWAIIATVLTNVFGMNRKDFVDTGVYIEEEGYQGELFTVNGITYEWVEDLWTEPEGREAVYTYKSDGFLSGNDRGNYYRVENDGGFDLVCCEYGSIYCPTEQYEKVYKYYTNEKRLIWTVDGGQPLSAEVSKKFNEFTEQKKSTEHITADEIIGLTKQTPDGAVYTDWYEVAVEDGTMYLVDFYEGEAFGKERYTASRLPDDLADAIKAANK